jgi:hypothetical protein
MNRFNLVLNISITTIIFYSCRTWLVISKGYWSLEEIGNACLKKGVSFEMLNPPFKHCDSKESKKTLLAIEFSNMMIRDYPIHYPEDDE